MGDTWAYSKEFYQTTSPLGVARMLDFIRQDVSAECRLKNRGQYAALFKSERAQDYKKYFLKHLPAKGKYIGLKDQEQVLEIFSKYRALLAQDNCLTHGDLHPGNMVCNRSKLVLHDWKYAHWDNPYLDFTFIWFLTWLDEKWRGEFFRLEEKKAEDKELFRTYFYLSVLKLTPKMISILTQVSSISKKDFEKGVKKQLSVFKEAINYLGCRK